jgi:NAD(P)-dependent dehydrogenase (short-subunit alcohol dehydrogenase family)
VLHAIFARTKLMRGACVRSGIGREACLLFAREGSKVVVADVSEVGAQAVADLIIEHGGQAVAVRCDVSQEDQVKALVDTAERKFGGLHVLFNNAGVMLAEDDDAVNTPIATILKTMAVNVNGVLFGCKFGVPALRRSGGGSVINTVGVWVKVPETIRSSEAAFGGCER